MENVLKGHFQFKFKIEIVECLDGFNRGREITSMPFPTPLRPN